MNEYKKAWGYLKYYKKSLALKVLFLLLFQFVSFCIPLIIQRIIDDKILAVENPIVQVESYDDDSMKINSSYYKYEVDIDEDDVVLNSASVTLLDEGFYLINDKVGDGTRKLISENEVQIGEQVYNAIPLSSTDLKNFYNPIIPSLVWLLCMLLLFSLLELVFTYMDRIIGANISLGVTKQVRKDAMQKIEKIPIQIIEDEPVGKTVSRLVSDSSGVANIYISSINIIFAMGFSLIFSYIGLFIYSKEVATIILFVVPIIVLWTRFFVKKINVIVEKISETNSLIVAQINESINGIGILKIFNSKEKKVKEFNELNQKYVDQTMVEQKLHLKSGWNGLDLFKNFVSGMVIVIFGYLFLRGYSDIEPGKINSFYMYTLRIIAPIGILFSEISNITNHRVKIGRIFKILDSEEEDQELIEIEPYNGDVEFNNVNFTYDGKTKILNNVNLKIKAGEKIGLVGHTGSGKSTMMNLLLRFNDLKDGEILIDGESIDKYSKRTYRQHIGIILQEPILFSGTIYENICYGKDVSKEEAKQYLIDVGGERIVNKYKNGIDEKISRKGNNLSLGEKQLISFARIMAYNPSVIILDEATANIDTETEELFNRALKVISKGKTLIVIAHRLATIVDSDKIVLLDKGSIIEEGSHKELLKLNGQYANMYRQQVSIVNE